MKSCYNHPYREALSICKGCGKYYCSECIEEVNLFYYCREPGCRELLKMELSRAKLPVVIDCPNCNTENNLSENERASRNFHCAGCEALIDFNSNPPLISDREKFVELISTFNQGDIALIQSVLDDSNISYFIYDENFMRASPLIQPARIVVNESQLEDAKSILRNCNVSI